MTLDQQQSFLQEIQRIADIELTVRAELDQSTLTYAELLDLEVGSLVQLPRPTGENVDIYVEEALLGWGEVLLMDGRMTVRLSDLRNARVVELEGDEVAPEENAGQGREANAR